MSIWRYLLWAVLAASATGIFILIRQKALKNGKPFFAVAFFAVRVLMIPLLGLLAVYWDTAFGWKCNMLICAFYMASFGTVLGDFLCATMKSAARINLNKYDGVIRFLNQERNRIRITAGLSAAVFLYGTLCSQIVFPHRYVFTSEKLEQTYEIAVVSDLHYGSTQAEAVVRGIFGRIRKESPDLLILCGDITDEFTSKEQMETVYRIIGETGLKTVAVCGNHDRQAMSKYVGGRTYTDGDLLEAMRENGIELLKEEYLQAGPDLVLLGRADAAVPEERTVSDGSGNPDPEALFVVLDHIQYPEDALLEVGADLQISGHSHAGQYIPLRLIYELAGANPLGEYRYGDAVLYTGIGTSGWRVPFRTEKFCHYELITLKPAE